MLPPPPSTGTPGFWSLAVLILLPVLILAGLAGWGLWSQRRAVEGEARTTAQGLLVSAGKAADVSLNGVLAEEVPVILYAEPPEPGARTERNEELERAIAAKDIPTLTALSQWAGSLGVTESGLPVRVMAAWHAWQLVPGPATAETLARLAIHDEPSAMSDRFLRAMESQPAGAETGSFAARWKLASDRRRELRYALASGLLPPVPDTLPISPDSPLLVPKLVRQSTSPGLMRLRCLPDGSVSVMMDYQKRMGPARLEMGMAKGAWPWAGIEIREADAPPDSLPADVLAVERRPGFTVLVRLADRALLYAAYERMVLWASVMLGGAVLAAVTGLWIIHRTLQRERRLGEMKSQFVSSVSHELRAPVGSLRLMAEALACGKVSGAPADEFHRLMASEGARLSALIENVLDFARIEQGRKHYSMAETEAGTLVEDTVKLMTPLAAARGQVILTEISPLPEVPQVDAAAIQQALVNLLDNASKFSPPDSRIRVGLAPGQPAGAWSLTVTDEGPGIPEAERERIFERFYRLGNELRRETTGTGIGLAIVKHIIDAHGGTVHVHSKPAEGTTFTLQFPPVAPVSDPGN